MSRKIYNPACTGNISHTPRAVKLTSSIPVCHGVITSKKSFDVLLAEQGLKPFAKRKIKKL